MVFVLVAKVAEIRFVVFVFVKYMVHVVPPKDTSVGRLVVAVMRVIVAEMGLSLRVVEIMGIRVVCMMVLMVRMVMAKVESRMLALRWWLGSRVGLKDLFLSGKTTASPSSLSDRVPLSVRASSTPAGSKIMQRSTLTCQEPLSSASTNCLLFSICTWHPSCLRPCVPPACPRQRKHSE